MPRLPDIPLQSWLEDQQQRFREATDGLFPSLEFEMGARDAQAQIPPDYDAVGGMDQWKEAEQSLIERESRLAQQQDEERRQQEIDAMAEQFRQQQAQSEQEEQARKQQEESSFMGLVKGLGIPTPSDVFSSFPSPGDHQSTSGVFNAPPPQPAAEPSSDPVTAFNQFAGGMTTDAFGAPTPDPLQNREQPPDNESSTGVFDRLGSAANRAWESSAPEAWRPGTDRYEHYEQERARVRQRMDEGSPLAYATAPLVEINRALSGVNDLVGGGALGLAGRTISELAGEPEIGTYAPGARDIPLVGDALADSTVTELAAPMLPLPGKGGKIVDALSGVGKSPVVGKIASETVDAIKHLIAQGMDEEAAVIERKLAQTTSATLDEIRTLTRGIAGAEDVIPGGPLTAEEQALNAAADVRARAAPRHAGYIEDPTFGADPPRGLTPAEAIEQGADGFDDLTDLGPRSRWERADTLSDARNEARAGVPRLPEAERVRRAQELVGGDPDAIRDILGRALERDPNMGAVETEVMSRHVNTLGDYFDEVMANITRSADEVESYGSNPVPSDVANEAAYWTNEGARLYQELKQAAMGRTYMGTAAAKSLQAQKGGRAGAILYTKSKQLDEVAESAADLKQALDDLRAGPEGADVGEARKAARKLGQKLNSPKNRKNLTEGEGAAPRAPGEGAPRPPKEHEETLAERLGRLKREQGRLDEGGPEAERARVADEIGETLEQIRQHARESVKKRLEMKSSKTLSPAEIEQTINEAVGRRTVSKIMREENARQRGYWPKEAVDIGKEVEKGITKFYRDQTKLLESIDRQMQRRIDGALATEKRQAVREQVREMANRARVHTKEMLRHPDRLDSGATQHNEDQFDLILRQMEEHSNVGAKVANEMRERFWNQMGRKVTAREEQMFQTEQRGFTEARLREVQERIQEALQNSHAPGFRERLESLYDDISEISEKAGERASNQRRTADRAGILRAGMAADEAGADDVVRMLKNLDPDDPIKSLKGLFEMTSRPSLWRAAREVPFINMLSSPWTLGTNVSSTTLNALSRFIIRNPLEFVGSLGQTRGQVEALKGGIEAIPEGARIFGTTMKTGVNPRRLDEALGKGDFAHLQQEELPRYLQAKLKLGKLGEALHFVSTRPLAATDGMMGYMTYGAGIREQAMQRADELIRTKDRKLGQLTAAGVDTGNRAQVAEYIGNNIWDFPEVMKAAGELEDYTLFRSKGKNPLEQAARLALGVRNKPPGSWQDVVASGMVDFLMPFYNVPMNFTKQGLKKLAHGVAAPVNIPRALIKSARGDTKAGGELFAKATEGAAILGLAATWAGSDNLTGVGPRDAGDRRVWLQDHKPNSWRPYKGAPWISYEGTPWAIPLGTVAGAVEDVRFEQKLDPNLSPMGQALTAIGGAGKGAIQGAMSHSLVEGLVRNFEFLTGQTQGWKGISQNLADTAGRYTPTGTIAPTGLMNFLATISDTVEREVANPRNIEEVPQAVLERLQQKIPGLRDDLPVRRDAYGDPLINERSIVGSRGASVMGPPGGLYRGYGPTPDDPITQQLQRGSIGMPDAPKEITMGRGTVPLTIAEQREFQARWGQEYRKLLEEYGAGKETLLEAELTNLREGARRAALGSILDTWTNEEIDRRWREKPVVEVAP